MILAKTWMTTMVAPVVTVAIFLAPSQVSAERLPLLLQGTFTQDIAPNAQPLNLDTISAIDSKGNRSVGVTGLDGLESFTEGPGGVFGRELYIATAGTYNGNDGNIFRLETDGNLTTIVENIDAFKVVFDTDNLFGGGFLVTDLGPFGASPEPRESGKVWRVSSTPESTGQSLIPGAPVVADGFSIDLLVDFGILGEGVQGFDAVLHPGGGGFDAGLYSTAPFRGNPEAILFVDLAGNLSILASGLAAPEKLVFARGAYGGGDPIQSDLRPRDIAAQSGRIGRNFL